MNTTGTVEYVMKNGKALVVLEGKKENKLDPKIEKTSTVSAMNSVKADVGDKVEVSKTKKNFDLAIKILYFMPLLGLLIAVLVSLTFDTSLLQFLFGLSAFIVSFLIVTVAIVVLKKKSSNVFTIMSIIEKAKEDTVEDNTKDETGEHETSEITNQIEEIIDVEEEKNEQN